jgi:hypothetical protein
VRLGVYRDLHKSRKPVRRVTRQARHRVLLRQGKICVGVVSEPHVDGLMSTPERKNDQPYGAMGKRTWLRVSIGGFGWLADLKGPRTPPSGE